MNHAAPPPSKEITARMSAKTSGRVKTSIECTRIGYVVVIVEPTAGVVATSKIENVLTTTFKRTPIEKNAIRFIFNPIKIRRTEKLFAMYVRAHQLEDFSILH